VRRFAIAVASVALLLLAAMPALSKPLSVDDLWAMGRVARPHYTPDGKFVVFDVTFYSSESNKGNSDLFMVAADGGEVRQLTQQPGKDRRAAVSPDGSAIAFESDRSGTMQIWLLPIAGGEATQLTHLSTGGSHPLWSSDGEQVLFRSSVFPDCPDDPCNAEMLEKLKNAPTEARLYDGLFYQHWNEWRDDRRSHLFVVPKGGGTPVDLTPYEWDVPTIALGSSGDIAVAPDGGEVCVVVNSNEDPALSIDNNLYLVGTDDVSWTQITSNPANDNRPVYSPDGKHIAYRAMKRPDFEADRYGLMLYNRVDGEAIEIGTALAEQYDRSVGEIVWSPDSKRIYVTCSDAGYNSLFEVAVPSGKVNQLTEKMFVSSVRVSPKGSQLVFLKQSASTPGELFVSKRNATSLRQLTHINDAIIAEIEMNSLEPFHYASADGSPVHGFLLKPPGFDATRKYPLVYLVHGGPQGAWRDSFHWRWNYQMFAAPGYVVSIINPRGSTGYGQQFTDDISTDWGGKVFDDLMAGLDFVVETFDFVDEDRMAAAGGSYGGYMMAWFNGHTDRFQALIDHAGVYDLDSFYGTTEELWFPEWEFAGTPWENPELYRQLSPSTYAADFKTPTLIIHGAQDFRVPLAQGRHYFTALQRQDIPSRLLVFPDEGHWILKPRNAELWWGSVHEWLEQYIGGEVVVP